MLYRYPALMSHRDRCSGVVVAHAHMTHLWQAPFAHACQGGAPPCQAGDASGQQQRRQQGSHPCGGEVREAAQV